MPVVFESQESGITQRGMQALISAEGVERAIRGRGHASGPAVIDVCVTLPDGCMALARGAPALQRRTIGSR